MNTAIATSDVDASAFAKESSAKKSFLRNNLSAWIVGAALVALFLKLAIAYHTFGSNDVVTFYSFARSLSDHGLEWTYRHSVPWLGDLPLFNHPPLTAHSLRLAYALNQQEVIRDLGFTFPFLIRLPGIIADFVVVLIMLNLATTVRNRVRLPFWALALFALSPVSLMVSGFHGNTDSVMVMFLALAGYACVKNRPWLCGLCLALSCQVKIIPLLFFPIFFFFWIHRRAIVPFLLPLALASLVLWWEPLFKFPILFFKNVLGYGSFWGLWGITYWLRLTQLPAFSMVTFFNFPPAEMIVVTALKLLIIISVLMIAWRRRALEGIGVLNSIAYAWIVFFIFSPGVCAQYMVWLAPFVLCLSPAFSGWLTAASSLFLFFFYNITANGFPWYIAISTNKLNTVWTPWSLWPWAALILGMFYFWRKAVAANPSLRLFSVETLPSNKSD